MSIHTPLRSVRVPPALWDKVKQKAAIEGTTVSAVVVAALASYADEAPAADPEPVPAVSRKLGRRAAQVGVEEMVERLAGQKCDLHPKAVTRSDGSCPTCVLIGQRRVETSTWTTR